MNWYPWLKWLHVLSSTILFGTGLGIAFFFIRAQRTNSVLIIAGVARDVVLADMVFTATAVILQPLSGVTLALAAGYSLFSPWLQLSVVIYIIVGVCWLRVVWLQIGMRDMAINAAATSSPLPLQYRAYYRQWLALGWPAFVGVMAIFYLMVAKPRI